MRDGHRILLRRDMVSNLFVYRRRYSASIWLYRVSIRVLQEP